MVNPPEDRAIKVNTPVEIQLHESLDLSARRMSDLFHVLASLTSEYTKARFVQNCCAI